MTGFGSFPALPARRSPFDGRLLADWATQRPQRRYVLLSTIKRGQDAVLALTLTLFSLTTLDVSRIRHLNRTVLVPMVRYFSTLPDMVSARTVLELMINPKPFSSLQEVIAAYCAYSELFHRTFAYNLRNGEPTDSEPFSLDTRQAWIAAFIYVVPDPLPCTCSCLRPPKRALAEGLNKCRKRIHIGAYEILSLRHHPTIHHC